MGLSLLHVPLIPTSYGDGRCMREQGNSMHTFKASANITFANTSLAKASPQANQKSEVGKYIPPLVGNTAWLHGKDVDIVGSEELGAVIYHISAFSSTFGIFKLLKMVCKGISLSL